MIKLLIISTVFLILGTGLLLKAQIRYIQEMHKIHLQKSERALNE
jgi:hypothetical protein